MGEHIDVELRSGGSVHMDIDANLLSLNIEDFEFVKGIYSLLTDYADLKVLRVERPKSAGGGVAAPKKAARVAKAAADKIDWDHEVAELAADPDLERTYKRDTMQGARNLQTRLKGKFPGIDVRAENRGVGAVVIIRAGQYRVV